MTTLEFATKVFAAVLPTLGFIVAIIIINVKMKKESTGVVADKYYGMREPTDEEAEYIARQVSARNNKKVLVISLIFVPLCVFATAAYVTNIQTANLPQIIGFGCLLFGLYAMYIGLIANPLSDNSYLKKRAYTVSDCRITDNDNFRAYVEDEKGYTGVFGLSKELRNVSAGTRCLVLIYDVEDKINSKRNDRPILRRELVV